MAMGKASGGGILFLRCCPAAWWNYGSFRYVRGIYFFLSFGNFTVTFFEVYSSSPFSTTITRASNFLSFVPKAEEGTAIVTVSDTLLSSGTMYVHAAKEPFLSWYLGKRLGTDLFFFSKTTTIVTSLFCAFRIVTGTLMIATPFSLSCSLSIFPRASHYGTGRIPPRFCTQLSTALPF